MRVKGEQSSIPVGHVQHSDFYPKSATATAKSLQSCPTLCDPIDGSPPASPVPGILQARIILLQCLTEFFSDTESGDLFFIKNSISS